MLCICYVCVCVCSVAVVCCVYGVCMWCVFVRETTVRIRTCVYYTLT